MPNERLTDPRDTSLEECDTLLREIFSAKLHLLRSEASAEARILEVRKDLAADTGPARLRLDLAEKRLSAAIHAHADQFENPRKRTTPWGAYGLQSSTRLSIEDDDALLQHAKEQGYLDLYRVQEVLVKPAITKRLKRGEPLPGCALDTAESSVYTLDPAALEAAL